jgi:hypothetical protein
VAVVAGNGTPACPGSGLGLAIIGNGNWRAAPPTLVVGSGCPPGLATRWRYLRAAATAVYASLWAPAADISPNQSWSVLWEVPSSRQL